jgi:hypothetical protein
MLYKYVIPQNKEYDMKQRSNKRIMEKTITFRVTNQQIEELKNLKEEQLVNLSALFRQCLNKSMEELRQKNNLLEQAIFISRKSTNGV